MIQPRELPERDDAGLGALIEEYFAARFATDNPLITEAVKRMLAAGGKRVRPRLTLLAAEAAGADPREHLALAAYMELIHVATLIHDDVVDRADTRRGVNATAIDYGNRISVLAGDYLFAWIFKNVTAGYPAPIPNILSSTLADICDGEVLQLRALGNVALGFDEYVEIVDKKTATLFAASAECGAIMGGGSAAYVRTMRDFGRYYGIAFQMHDDVLDVSASADEIGKPVGNDLLERKITLPVLFALAAPHAVRTQLERFYSGELPADAATIHALLRGIAEAGALEKAREAIAEYVERAKSSLAPLANAAVRATLCELADKLVYGPGRVSH